MLVAVPIRAQLRASPVTTTPTTVPSIDLAFTPCMDLTPPQNEPGVTDEQMSALATKLAVESGEAPPASAWRSSFDPSHHYELQTTLRNLGTSGAVFPPGAAVFRRPNGDVTSPRTLAAGAVLQVGVSLPAAELRAGTNRLSFIADPGNRVRETNERNNRAECIVELLAPDLTVTRVIPSTTTPRPGSTVVVDIEVANRGTESVPVPVTVSCGSAGTATVEGLDAGQTRRLQVGRVRAPAAGPMRVSCTVDPHATVAEPDRANNVRAATLRVTPQTSGLRATVR
jgi:hypothetical protein